MKNFLSTTKSKNKKDYFFVEIYKEPQEPPYKTYIVEFWNREFNLYKKQKLAMGKIKLEMEENSGGAVSK